MEEYKDIISLMEKSPRVQPPNNFTQAVMARVNDSFAAGNNDFAFVNLFKERVTNRDCAFCFFASGFFYLIIGLFLLVGLKDGQGESGVFTWIYLLPAFAVINAAALLFSGAAMLQGGERALRTVRACLLVYFIISAVISLSLTTAAPLPLGGLIIILAYGATSGLMGVILAISAGKLKQRT